MYLAVGQLSNRILGTGTVVWETHRRESWHLHRMGIKGATITRCLIDRPNRQAAGTTVCSTESGGWAKTAFSLTDHIQTSRLPDLTKRSTAVAPGDPALACAAPGSQNGVATCSQKAA